MTELARGTSQTSQTSGRVSDTDYTGWLTKAEAATAIGVTTKTVERLAADGQIQQGAAQRQGRGPTRAVYHPDDVARIASGRRQSPAAFVFTGRRDLTCHRQRAWQASSPADRHDGAAPG